MKKISKAQIVAVSGVLSATGWILKQTLGYDLNVKLGSETSRCPDKCAVLCAAKNLGEKVRFLPKCA